MSHHDPDSPPARPPAPPGSTTDWILRHNRLMRQEVVDEILDDRDSARQAAEDWRRRDARQRRQRLLSRLRLALTWSALALILGVGLYLRLDALGHVQNFGGDSGRDYLVVMDWLRNGQWPLLGPYRSISQDYAIGPGWFYTLAPALMLSQFNPGAGAATNGVLGILGVALAFFWVRRATGSALAGLALAALLAWGFVWVEAQRVCWNPQPLFLAMTAIALLIERAPRRPLDSLTLYLMLVAIIPHWHTTGLGLIVASAPWMAAAVWAGRGTLAASGWPARLGWGAALGGWLILLYLPPAIYEWTLDPAKNVSNLTGYFSRTFPAAAGSGQPWGERLGLGTDRFFETIATRNFVWGHPDGEAWPWLFMSLIGVSLAVAAVRRWCVRPRTGGVLAAGFLLSLLAGFWLVACALGKNFADYYGESFYAAPLLLGAWAAGTLIHRPEAGWRHADGLRLPAALGLVLIGLGFWQAGTQLPSAWAIHHGKIWHGERMDATVEIADWIRRDAGGRPISVLLADPTDIASGFHALIWRTSRRPLNQRSWEHGVPREQMGRVFYLIARGDDANARLKLEGGVHDVGPPVRVGDALIYQVTPASLPEGAGGIEWQRSDDGATLILRPWQP